MSDSNLRSIKALIRDVPDFPTKGILFKDITPVLADSAAFRSVIDEMSSRLKPHNLDYVVGIESRGFIFASALARDLSCGLALARKPGKLPYTTKRREYQLEYGVDALEMHIDAIAPGARVGVIDDLLATGGTAEAAVELCRDFGAEVQCLLCVIELGFLNGRARLSDVRIDSLIQY